LIGGSRRPERPADIGMTTGGRQAGLGLRRPQTTKRWTDRQAEVFHQVSRLIEPALAPTRWMERHRYDRMNAVQKFRAALAHEVCQRSGE